MDFRVPSAVNKLLIFSLTHSLPDDIILSMLLNALVLYMYTNSNKRLMMMIIIITKFAGLQRRSLCLFSRQRFECRCDREELLTSPKNYMNTHDAGATSLNHATRLTLLQQLSNE